MKARILLASILTLAVAWVAVSSVSSPTPVGAMMLPPRHSCAALLAEELPGLPMSTYYDAQTGVVTAEGALDYYLITTSETACNHPTTAAIRSGALQVHNEIKADDCAIFTQDPNWQGEPGLQPDVTKLAALKASVCGS